MSRGLSGKNVHLMLQLRYKIDYICALYLSDNNIVKDIKTIVIIIKYFIDRRSLFMGRLDGKVALITGGGSGLGEAMVRLFSKEGAKVVLTDINEKRGSEIVEEIKSEGKEAYFLKHDVTKEEEWKTTIDEIIGKYDALNIVVNNAGIGALRDIENTSLEDWNRVISINLDSVFLGTKHGILGIKKNNSVGSIINISSILGLVGDANAAAYNASKGGVRLLTKSAALHCAQSKYNIRVNSLHPGYVKTPLVDEALDEGHASVEILESLHPMGHLGEAIDMANGALFLASDEAKFVTGSELVIDGGYTAI